MADAPKLNGNEFLDESYYKINLAIDNANEAKNNVIAVDSKSEYIQKQLDTIAIRSKNLFNKDDILRDMYLDGNTGKTFVSAGYFTSQFILISPNSQYAIAKVLGDTRIAYYDVNKTYISRATDGSTTFTTPTNSYFIRIAAKLSLLDTTQLESGSIPTGYEKFGSKITGSAIPNKTIAGEVFVDKSIPPEKMKGVKFSKNLFSKNTAVKGKFIVFSTGLLADNSSYFASDYIPVDSNVEYIRTVVDQMAFYTSEKVYISGKTYTDPANFTTPANCAYVRVCAPLTKFETYQLEKGNVSTSYEEYKFEIDSLRVNIPGARSVICTFKDAWIAWENGGKFPVGFLGDSTTDGVGTTGWTIQNGHEPQDVAAGGWGKVDYINTKAYPYILEQLIKKATGKSTPRIYNIGYSGTYFDWAKPKIEEMFSGVYSDVKMVGISYGINDRTRVKTTTEYEVLMRTNLEYFINFFYDRGIQPFIVTSQATAEPGVGESYINTHPLRTSENINSVANRVKREIAKKYNLEIIEMTDFGEHVMTYSMHTLSQLIADKLHFGDKGHELEAGFIFSHFSPRTLIVKDTEVLPFNSQKIKSNVPDNKISFLSTFEDGFKSKANYTKSDSTDLLMQDFWVLNYGKKKFNLKAFLTTVGSQYIKLNDENIPLTSNGQIVSALDIGLHHIQVFSGETTAVDFKGFTLT